MDNKSFEGRVFKYGDSIDTDRIIPARYCTSYHAEDLAPHCLEDEDETFASRVNEGDILVAGENFGCGSSRENAPIAIRGAGAACVIAKSFARIFFRNSINIGLPILISPDAVEGIEDGDTVSVDTNKGIIRNVSKGGEWQAAPFPKEIQEIIDSDGLVGYVKKRLNG